MSEINSIIDGFNKNSEYLFTFFGADVNSPYSFKKLDKKILSELGLSLHRNYLMGFLLNVEKYITKINWRLMYNRTREFQKEVDKIVNSNKMLKNIECEINELSNTLPRMYKRWKNDLAEAREECFRSEFTHVIKAELKQKQRSRQKQLLEKFSKYEKSLKKAKTEKEIKFLGVVKKLVAILSGDGKNLSEEDVSILKKCFGENRNWKLYWKEKMVRQYNPFPSLNDSTNRVMTMLYGVQTDNDGEGIDACIQSYVK